MTSRQVPTQKCKSILSTLPRYFLQVVSAHGYSSLGAKWIHDVMAYIVDFTIIMQVISGFVVNARLRLSRRLIKLVFKAYNISEEKSKVHKEIKEHVKVAGRCDRDAALAKIIQLIKEYRMEPESMKELRSAVERFENDEDEGWDLGKAWLYHSDSLCTVSINSINSSHLVTCDRRDEILVSSHHWGVE